MRREPKTLVILSISVLGTVGCGAMQATPTMPPQPGVPQCALQSKSLTPQTNGLGVLTAVTFVAPSDAAAKFLPTRCCGRLMPETVHTMCTANGSGTLSTTFTLAQGTSQTVSRSVILPWKNVAQVRTIASGYSPIYLAFQCTVPVVINGESSTCSYSSQASFSPSSLPAQLNQSAAPACCALLDGPAGPVLARSPGAEPWWRAESPAASASSAPSPLPDPGTLARLDATWR